MKKSKFFRFIVIVVVVSSLMVACASTQTQSASFADSAPALLVIRNNLTFTIINVSVSPSGRNSWVIIDNVYVSPAGQDPWKKLDVVAIAPNHFMYTESLLRIVYDIRIEDSEGNIYTFLNVNMQDESGKMLTITPDKKDN